MPGATATPGAPPSFHVEKLLSGVPPEAHMPLELGRGDSASNHRQYQSWLAKESYSALITSLRWLRNVNVSCKHQPEIAVMNVDKPGEMGIDLNLPQMADTALELLVLEMQRILILDQSLLFRIHIPGRWVEASTPLGRSIGLFKRTRIHQPTAEAGFPQAK